MRVCPECGRRSEDEVCPVDGRRTIDEALLEDANDWKGRVIAGKYQLEAELGSGGMGAVYRARHMETGGAVALKLLHPQAAGKAQLIRRFSLEAQNAASLQHVNTIRVIDFGVEAGVPFLVMEHLDGEPLSTTLRREGALAWRRAARIAQQIFASLAEAHGNERRIIHRDIKPANIFLMDQAGQRDFVKVLDFGISRSLEGAGADTRGPIGTPHYMSPEQWHGGEIDGRADLYAVGCLLYEMLAGAPPFDVDRTASIARQMTRLADLHLHHDPEPLDRKVHNDVPPGLISLTQSLLAKEADRRPSTAEEVVERLTQVIDNPELDADRPWLAATNNVRKPVHAATGATRAPTPNPELDTMDMSELAARTPIPGAAEVAAAGSGAAGAGSEAATPSPVTPTPATPTPATPTPSTPTGATPGGARRGWVAALVGLLLVGVGGVWWWQASSGPEAWLATVRSADASADARLDATRKLLANRKDGGVRLRRANLSKLALSAGDLSEADLQEARLDDSDLRKANLTGADLRKARLRNADLRGANLRLADLRGANLDGANLTGTGLKGTRYDDVTRWPEGFDYAHSGAIGPKAALGGVDLRGADLRGSSLAGANLQRGQLADANLAKARLKGVNARGASLNKAVLRGADLRDADLRGADLRGADLRGAKLEGVNLDGARYSKDTRFPKGFKHRTSGAVGPKAVLVKRDLRDQDLSDADLREADLRRSKLQGADLSRARLERARFEGAQYDDRTRWPKGFDADRAGAQRTAADKAAGAPGQGGDTAVRPTAPAAAPDAPPAADSPAEAPVAKPAEAPADKAPPEAAPAKAAAAKPTPRRGPRRRAKARPAAVAEVEVPKAEPPPAPKPAAPTLVRPSKSEVEGANLSDKDVSRWDLKGFDLRWTRYSAGTRWPAGFNAKRSGALGPGAHLAGRDLRKRRLSAIDLRGANLSRADLRGAKLIGARLERADLRGARLQGADLRGSRLSGAKLDGARFDASTRWPSGYQAADHGAKLTL